MEKGKIYEAIEAGRKVQDFLWDESGLKLSEESPIHHWSNVFQKRVNKIKEIDKLNQAGKSN